MDLEVRMRNCSWSKSPWSLFKLNFIYESFSLWKVAQKPLEFEIGMLNGELQRESSLEDVQTTLQIGRFEFINFELIMYFGRGTHRYTQNHSTCYVHHDFIKIQSWKVECTSCLDRSSEWFCGAVWVLSHLLWLLQEAFACILLFHLVFSCLGSSMWEATSTFYGTWAYPIKIDMYRVKMRPFDFVLYLKFFTYNIKASMATLFLYQWSGFQGSIWVLEILKVFMRNNLILWRQVL